ncbi:hypothetical protein ACFWCA_19595 [Streptomyces phaeochromogenes]|uniref:hypothetical protein n=1 Tax=Streptomyces phaeochromogenes TaxID=1923 RepID=UPI00369E5BE2
MKNGEWYLGYNAYDNLPGAALTFGREASGMYCLKKPDTTFGEADVGDAPMPGEDGIRLGRDYQRTATVTFEIGVDGVDRAIDRHYPMRPWGQGARVGEWDDIEAFRAIVAKRDESPELRAADGVDLMRQVWRADALRKKASRVAWLLHTTGGRTRRLYGRPRKFAVSDSQLSQQGYTPVVADFLAVDDRFYDDVEQTSEMWDYAPGNRPGRPGRPTLPGWGTAPSKKTVTFQQRGKVPTFPVITIHGPCKNPKVTLTPGLWAVQLSMTIAQDEYVTIDPRPWMRTVVHTAGSSSKSVADKLTRASPRLAEMYLPPGYWTAALAYTSASTGRFDGPRVEIKWRNAFTWW